jgi:hypothetical protein
MAAASRARRTGCVSSLAATSSAVRSAGWRGTTSNFCSDSLGSDITSAIPGQGSTSHLNEQWLSYWAQLFAARGYQHVDCLRRRLWHDESGAPWYAQNALLYVTSDYLAQDEALARLHDPREPEPLPLVHPTRYLEWVEWARRYAADPAT